MSAHRGQVGFGLELRAVQYEVGELRHLLEERKVGADTQCQVVPSCSNGMWTIAWNWLTTTGSPFSLLAGLSLVCPGKICN